MWLGENFAHSSKQVENQRFPISFHHDVCHIFEPLLALMIGSESVKILEKNGTLSCDDNIQRFIFKRGTLFIEIPPRIKIVQLCKELLHLFHSIQNCIHAFLQQKASIYLSKDERSLPCTLV